MSLIVDQSWVKEWQGKPTAFQRDVVVSWFSQQDRAWRALMAAFPPFCLVSAKRTLEVPCPHSVGFVMGYTEAGSLEIAQEPGGAVAVVSPDDLSVVGFWKDLTPQAISNLFS